jgi:virginiamycin B lyase
LGRLTPASGEVEEIPLGAGSAPHGVVVGPDGAAWITDGGLDAIIRVDEISSAVDLFPIGIRARLNTAAFDGDGDVFYASLAGSHIARIDTGTGEAERIDPPTPGQGARRVWSDSSGMVWVAEWNAGQVGRFDPVAGTWDEWKLPGESPQAYAVYVDETDKVWLSDFGGDHALVRFDPVSETFERFPLPVPGGAVRQLLGIPGEVWGALSAADALVVLRYER